MRFDMIFGAIVHSLQWLQWLPCGSSIMDYSSFRIFIKKKCWKKFYWLKIRKPAGTCHLYHWRSTRYVYCRAVGKVGKSLREGKDDLLGKICFLVEIIFFWALMTYHIQNTDGHSSIIGKCVFMIFRSDNFNQQVLLWAKLVQSQDMDQNGLPKNQRSPS